MSKPVVLITGASSGIGRSLAEVFAAHRHDLVLVARNEARLREVAETLARDHRVKAHVLLADLAGAGAAQRIMQAVSDMGLSIEVLVNNAGFGVYGPAAESDVQDELDMLQVNVVALTHLTKLVLPQMLARGRGRILNVASTAAFLPGPFMAGYFASKAYVLSYSEGIASELAGAGVTVTALCPGPIQTGFQTRARMQDSKLVHGKTFRGPNGVARAAYRGLMRGDTLVVPRLLDRLMIFAERFLPRRLVAALTRRIMQRRTA